MPDLEAHVRAQGLLEPGRPVVVLVSGGRDSVCLLDLAARVAGPAAVTALHVDYGLRPESAEDAAFVERLAARLGVPCEVQTPRSAPRGNLQGWAREERYAAARAHGVDVATGHTASDQVETVLYRLAASPGRRALLGMRERDGRVIRPLLSFTRAQTSAYCAERDLPWRDDPTNDGDEYARNRARHGLVPALRELHPAAEANVLRTLDLLRDEAAVLDAVVDEALTTSLAALRELPAALARLVLERLAGAPVGSRAGEILGLPDAGSASLDLGGGLRAVSEYGALRFTRAGAPGPAAPVRLPVPGRAGFAGGALTAECGTDLPLGDGTLDARPLAATLEVRAWRPGDRMRPLGLGGSKSLQDLFGDRKVPRERRSRWPVVVSAGEIAWVPGVATGERFRVTPGTAQRVRLTWTGI